MDLKTDRDINRTGRDAMAGRSQMPRNCDQPIAIQSIRSSLPFIATTARQAVTFGLILCSIFFAITIVQASEKQKRTLVDVEKRFKELDRNRDGRLSVEEFPRAKFFELIDTDRDGFISLEESRNHFNKRTTQAADNTEPADFIAKDSSESSVRKRFRILKPADHLVGRIVPDFSFRDIDGIEHRVSEFKSHAATVIAVTSTSCPLSKRYLPTLARLEKSYAKQVRFVFVNATSTDANTAIHKAIDAHDLNGPYVLDRDEVLLSAVGAKSTTDCFVIDQALTLRYRGAVDDQYGFGYALEQPKQLLLADALNAVLSGQTPLISATDAPGCLLNYGKSKPKAVAKAEETSVTYHNRISRIVQANCVECHHDGGVAPFSLTQPEELASHAAMISRVVENGTMPPWFAAPSAKGTTNVWLNDRSLTEPDKKDLLNWLNSDRPLGNPAEAPIARTFVEGWHNGEPDAVIQLPKPIVVPAEGIMPYQQVIVETGFDEDKWVRGFDIRPTASSVVHHVGVFVESGSSPAKKGDEMEKSGRYLALYVPGNSWRLFPDGCAKLLPKKSRLRFQIHYAPTGTAAEDQTRLGLYFSKQPPTHELYATGVLNPAIKIPPKVSDHKETARLAFPADIQILSFLPHMHVRGKSFRFEAVTKGDASTVLLDVPRYDFNWQLAYHLSEPYTLPKGAKLRVRGVFDNSSRNPANPDPTQTVYWGQQSHEEMLLGYIEYIVPSETLIAKDR